MATRGGEYPRSRYGALSSKMRHRVRIDAVAQTRDPSSGEVFRGWVPFLNREPAAILALSGREWVEARQIVAGTAVRIVIRARPGIKTSMRVVDLGNGTEYAIHVILPDPTQRRNLALICSTTNYAPGIESSSSG